MSKRTTDVVIEEHGNYVVVWTDHNVELARKAQMIPGVNRAQWLRGNVGIKIDPRYDLEEVMSELKVLIKTLGKGIETKIKICPMCNGTGEVAL